MWMEKEILSHQPIYSQLFSFLKSDMLFLQIMFWPGHIFTNIHVSCMLKITLSVIQGLI